MQCRNWGRGGLGIRGDFHTCAVRSDGSVWCWGSNGSGQLGDGSTNSSATPLQVSSLSLASMVSVGQDFSCALKQDGTVWCWGAGSAGQLGDGSGVGSNYPVQVNGIDNAAVLAAGSAHACVLDGQGTLFCWGSNDHGQLGQGTVGGVQKSPVQVDVFGNQFDWVACGQYHTCAGGQSGTYCWGDDSQGQLGNGTGGGSATPMAVVGIGPMAVGGTGESTTCAANGSNLLYCWGDNDYGEVGDGTTVDATEPRLVNFSNPVGMLEGGWKHVCLLDNMGSGLSCWGWNNYGQLGNGSTTDATVPVPVAGLGQVDGFSAGWYHTCAFDSNGALWCWGRNRYGELGLGYTSTSANTPQKVSLP